MKLANQDPNPSRASSSKGSDLEESYGEKYFEEIHGEIEHLSAEPTISLPPNKNNQELKSIQVDDLPLKMFVPVGSFINQEEEPIKWLVDKLIPLGWPVLLAGKSKAGKTLLALDLAKSVATGCDFLGKKTTQGSVALVLLDDPPSLVRKRLKDFGFSSGIPVFVSTKRFDENKFFQQLEQSMKEIKPLLVIVDTLVKIVPKMLGSENDAVTMDGALEKFAKIAETCKHPTFIFIHHLNKSGDIRGSTAIEGASPMVIKVTRQEDRLIELKFEIKLEPLPALVAKLDNNRWKFLCLGEKDALVQAKLTKDVLEYLRNEPCKSIKEIADKIRTREASIKTVVANQNLFFCENLQQGRGRPKEVYSVTEDKREFSSQDHDSLL